MVGLLEAEVGLPTIVVLQAAAQAALAEVVAVVRVADPGKVGAVVMVQ